MCLRDKARDGLVERTVAAAADNGIIKPDFSRTTRMMSPAHLEK